ncbi:hypothetical protein LzC2_24210 [Planctomycetes bacterium LzC2]|uniref:Ig-like domain-containing protein n=1 Tax=Alienimonas chondri TaxID=2681879 RepID=A0ABX1VE07_9PLAN|nr:hypothetical protein [Alienimonas chondri]
MFPIVACGAASVGTGSNPPAAGCEWLTDNTPFGPRRRVVEPTFPAASAAVTVTAPTARSLGMRNDPVRPAATGTRWADPPWGVKETVNVAGSADGSATVHCTAVVPSPAGAADRSIVGATRSIRTRNWGTIATFAGAGCPVASTVSTLNQ